MSVSDLEKAFDLIEQNKDKKYVSGCKEEALIEQAEKVLQLRFPPTYRKFLRKYGCGGIDALEIYGLTKGSYGSFDKLGVPDGIWFTLDQRKTGAPHSFIFIGSAGYGPLYLLDASQPDKYGEYPVLLWMPGSPETPPEKINNDFGEFLLEQVKQALEVEDDPSA